MKDKRQEENSVSKAVSMAKVSAKGGLNLFPVFSDIYDIADGEGWSGSSCTIRPLLWD